MATELQDITVLNAVDETGFGTGVNVSDFDEVLIMLAMEGSNTATVKVAGSIQNTQPTWGSAASGSNHWDYVDVTDMEDGASIDGDTGVSTSGSADLRSLRVSTTGLEWINVQVSAYTGGTVTAKVKGRNYNA